VILAFILKLMSSSMVDKVVSYLEEKQKTQQNADALRTQITIETIKATIAQQQLQASIVQAEIGSRLLAVPRFVIEMSVAALVVAWVVEAIDPSARLGEVDPRLLNVVTIVLAGMFTLGAIAKIKN
jgi:Na+/glutamate symporter